MKTTQQKSTEEDVSDCNFIFLKSNVSTPPPPQMSSFQSQQEVKVDRCQQCLTSRDAAQ